MSADALTQRVVDAVRRLATVSPDDVGPLAPGLPSRLNERFRELVPDLGVRGRYALTWRGMHRRYDA